MNCRKTGLFALVGFLLQLGAAGPALAVDGVHSVEQLLRKLSLTLQEQNYRGLFTYEYGGTLDTLEVAHWVDDGVEFERLQHLNGPDRKVVRSGRSTDCVNPAAQLLRGRFTSSGGGQTPLSDYYDLSLAGRERVANRSVTVVRLLPKDPYRYGLTFSVDRASGFPMKTLIIGDDQRVLERLQFVELQLGVRAEEFSAEFSQEGYLTLPSASAACTDGKAESTAVTSADTNEAWQATWLPSGFVLSERTYSDRDGHQLTYTDGLASFSIFVTPAVKMGRVQPTVAQRGATVALMLPLQDRAGSVTVVGEVPPVTAEKVALGLRRTAAGEQQ